MNENLRIIRLIWLESHISMDEMQFLDSVYELAVSYLDDERPLVDYQNFESFIEFISRIIGKDLEIPKVNISPKIDKNELLIKEDTFKKIEEFISLDKEIYEQLLKLGSFNSQNNDHKKIFKSIFQKYS